MKKFFLISMMIFIGCNTSQNDAGEPNDNLTPTSGLSAQTLQHNGEEREYQLYLPNSYNEETSHPVLLNFHGFGGNAKDYFTFESDFQKSLIRRA